MSIRLNQEGQQNSYVHDKQAAKGKQFNATMNSDCGKTAVSAQQMLAGMFNDMSEILERSKPILSPYDAHMASFHLNLLMQEFMKPLSSGEPGADIIMMAGTWLQKRVPAMRPALARLWLSVVAADVISRAGYSLGFWVSARLSNYEIEGAWLNLKGLHETLQKYASAAFLLQICAALNFDVDKVSGSTPDQKVQEILAVCVRQGRLPELNAFLMSQQEMAKA